MYTVARKGIDNLREAGIKMYDLAKELKIPYSNLSRFVNGKFLLPKTQEKVIEDYFGLPVVILLQEYNPEKHFHLLHNEVLI